ncbi:MAG: ester cyclase [Acidobacteriota bacterium]|nr:ester cyclase [Acidobacteriota bacterium]
MNVYPDAREVGRRWFEEVWNARRDECVEELLSPDSRGHIQGGEYRGPEGFREMQRVFLSALPDVHIEIEDILAEGNRAAVRWRATGTHRGDGLGFPPSGRTIDVRGTTWLVVENGKAIEGWDTWDLTGMVASLQSPPPG